MSEHEAPINHYIVEFVDGSTEKVSVDETSAQSDDHVAEMISVASSRPDDVDDWWPAGSGSKGES